MLPPGGHFFNYKKLTHIEFISYRYVMTAHEFMKNTSIVRRVKSPVFETIFFHRWFTLRRYQIWFQQLTRGVIHFGNLTKKGGNSYDNGMTRPNVVMLFFSSWRIFLSRILNQCWVIELIIYYVPSQNQDWMFENCIKSSWFLRTRPTLFFLLTLNLFRSPSYFAYFFSFLCKFYVPTKRVCIWKKSSHSQLTLNVYWRV